MVLEFYIDSVIFSSVRLAFCIRKKEHLEKTFFKNFEISRNLLKAFQEKRYAIF